jgi:hypothetical protein
MMPKNFQLDRAKYKNGIINIYNPEGNSYEKQNSEKLSRFEKVKEDFKKYASLFRSYPDLFIDMITPPESNFKLFFYQRLFLRVCMRYRYVYATFTRAFSKSFLSILTLYLKSIFYPGIKQFVASGGKEQAANIAKEKIEEIWELFPILKREVRDYQFQKDYVKLVFHNGSKLDIVAVKDSTRGGRRHAGLIEEVILVDGQKLSEVVIPLMNVDRRARNGEVDPNEPHKQQIYVTTAGFKNTFAYQKMIQILIWMVTKDNAFVMGGDYRIPVMHKLLDENFVEELKEDGTFNELSFAREYQSIWSGSSEDAFFDVNMIDRNRVLTTPEFEPDKKDKDSFYIISADVARVEGKQNANTVAHVIKATPRSNGTYLAKVVNTVVLHGEHFQEQSIKLKKMVFKFDARMLVVDAQGAGVGLVDFLVKENIDDETGDIVPPFSVVNDSDYDKYKTPTSLPLLYAIKATNANASQIHINCLSQISSGKVKFLVDEMTAKQNLLKTKKGQTMSPTEMADYLAPFINTSLMKEEMMNLRQKQSGQNIQLERINSKLQKDRFSALEYGLWYLKLLEDENINKNNNSFDDYFFFMQAGF